MTIISPIEIVLALKSISVILDALPGAVLTRPSRLSNCGCKGRKRCANRIIQQQYRQHRDESSEHGKASLRSSLNGNSVLMIPALIDSQYMVHSDGLN
ncbi:hypothetical protein [Budvicia aquatica]|uniref:hypothetical protein n=1 Tax=Budvicia aquatica TaxID=82979 RepID=UPI0021C2B3CB|nr:hypothetical protein [Budvicia aquatica]